MLAAQSREPLLLGLRVDVCCVKVSKPFGASKRALLQLTADDKGDKVEEWDPSLLGKELLGKRQTDWRSDPADLHDRPEASLDGGADLVESARTSNNCHEDEVNAVLNRRDLREHKRLVNGKAAGKESYTQSDCWRGSA